MMIKSKFCFILIFALLISAFGCTKDVTGPKGDPGTPGLAGNLVLKQITKTIDSLDWSKLEATWETEIFLEELNKNVLEKGEVKVYLNTESDWWVLPHGKNYIFTQAVYELGKIRLITEHIHGGIAPRPIKTTYRIVWMSPVE